MTKISSMAINNMSNTQFMKWSKVRYDVHFWIKTLNVTRDVVLRCSFTLTKMRKNCSIEDYNFGHIPSVNFPNLQSRDFSWSNTLFVTRLWNELHDILTLSYMRPSNPHDTILSKLKKERKKGSNTWTIHKYSDI